MCAIAGMIFLDNASKFGGAVHLRQKELLTIFEHMMKGIRSGGGSAAGLFVANFPSVVSTQGNMWMYKNNVSSDKLLDDPKARTILEKIIPGRTIYAVAHARAATCGDASSNDNNHPFRCGNVVGIHNGIINNHRKK